MARYLCSMYEDLDELLDSPWRLMHCILLDQICGHTVRLWLLYASAMLPTATRLDRRAVSVRDVVVNPRLVFVGLSGWMCSLQLIKALRYHTISEKTRE